MSRNRQLLGKYISKKAYQYKWDNISLEDIVTAGHDVDKLSDEVLHRATWQEGMLCLRDMMQNSEFTKDEWIAKLSSLLRKSGVQEETRIEKIAKEATDNVYEYLSSVGWM